METIMSNLYEGMFLIDAARAGSDWDGVISTIKKILERAEAEIISIRKWDDRKLAYDIKHQSRGVYILCYFRVGGEKIQEIEKNINLSEQIMRVLILNAEHMTQEDIEKDTPATKAEKEDQKTVEEVPKQEKDEQEIVKDAPVQEAEEQQSIDRASLEEQETKQSDQAEGSDQMSKEKDQDSEDSESEVIADD